MLKYIEDVLFAPKTFSHLQSNDNKQQGDNENSQSVSQSTTSKEIPEEFKIHIYMVTLNSIVYEDFLYVP